MHNFLLSLNNIDIITHKDNIKDDDYLKYINKYLCCFTFCLNQNTPYITNKIFEIPSIGSLLLAYNEFIKEPLKQSGLIDRENYISCNKQNILENIFWTCNNNIDKINKIRQNGYNFSNKNHTEYNGYELLYNITKIIIKF